MAITADEIIALAKATTGLTDEQREKILSLAPNMPEADLEKLKALILDVKKAEDAAREELKVRQEVEAQYKIYKKDEAMTTLKAAENQAATEDSATAENLINNL